MDQNFEAVLAMVIFILVFSTTNYVCVANYASSIVSKLDSTLNHYASIAANAIVLNCSNNDGWDGYAPSDDSSLYGLPYSISIWVNATTFSLSGSNGITPIWTRLTSQPPAFRTGECVKLVEAGNGIGVIITVRAW